MVSYKDGSTQQPLGSSPQALATLEGLAAQFMAPSAPSPQLAVEQHVRNGRDVVSALMLDRRTSDLTEQAIDRWVATGGIGAFQPPLALPPRQEAQLQRRVSALVAQRKKVMPFANAPPSPIDAQVQMDAVTREPSRDRLHALARTNLATYLAGQGSRNVTSAPTTIRKNLPMRAANFLKKALAKAGEGSRGGKIVGHSKSGKPIYARSARGESLGQTKSGKTVYSHMHGMNYSMSDGEHAEAAAMHTAKAKQIFAASKRLGESGKDKDSKSLHMYLRGQHHLRMANSHGAKHAIRDLDED